MARQSRRAVLKSATAVTATAVATAGCSGSRAEQPVRIGWLSPLSGSSANLGAEQRRGAELVTKRLNESGGIDGREIQSVYEDTRGDVQSGQQKARKLVEEDDVDMISGCFLSDVILSIMPYLDEQNVPFLCTGAASAITRSSCTRTTFNIVKRPTQVVNAIVPWATGEFGGDGWVHYADYVWGESGRDAVEAAAAATSGASVVGTSKTDLGTTDFSAQISEIANADVDWAYVQLLGGDAVNFVKQAASFGLKAETQLLLAGANSTKGFRQGVGDRANGTYTTVKYYEGYDTDANREFRSQYREEYGTEPSLPSWTMWVTGHLYEAAVARAGSTNTDDIVETLPDVQYDTGMGTGSFRSCDHIFTLPTLVGEFTERSEYDWPGFDIVQETPAEETMLACSETGCDLG